MPRLDIIAAAAVLLGATSAQAGDAAQGTAAPRVPVGASADGFTVALVHTEDRGAFNRAWFAGTWALPISDRAVRGRPLAAIVIFQGCRAGPDGNCRVTAHFTYLRPDGSVEGEVDGDLWNSQPGPGGAPLPSPNGPDLTIEPDDPAGSWTVRVRVTDAVRQLSVTTEARITVDPPPGAPAR